MTVRHLAKPSDFDAFGAEILACVSEKGAPAVIALSGDLGAGKTTFTQSLAKLLGVTEQVVSPTFMIMKMYETTHPLYTKLVHIDAYRIESDPEIEVLRIPELLAEDGVIACIEWPEKMETFLPKNALRIRLSETPDNARTAEYGD